MDETLFHRTPSTRILDSASSSTNITNFCTFPFILLVRRKKHGSPLFLDHAFSAHSLVLEQKSFSERSLTFSDPGSGAPKALQSTASNSFWFSRTVNSKTNVFLEGHGISRVIRYKQFTPPINKCKETIRKIIAR